MKVLRGNPGIKAHPRCDDDKSPKGATAPAMVSLHTVQVHAFKCLVARWGPTWRVCLAGDLRELGGHLLHFTTGSGHGPWSPWSAPPLPREQQPSQQEPRPQ